MLWALLVLQMSWSQWKHFDSTKPNVILNGVWASCREDDGQFGERIWDYVVDNNSKWVFEFHMGPYHEFALYRTKQDDEHNHSDDSNELKPYDVIVEQFRANQTWDLQDVRINVVLTGGSRDIADRCEQFFVTIERKR